MSRHLLHGDPYLKAASYRGLPSVKQMKVVSIPLSRCQLLKCDSDSIRLQYRCELFVCNAAQIRPSGLWIF